MASLLPLYLEGDILAFYIEMEETSPRDAKQLEAQLKEVFTDHAFIAYRKLTIVKWAGETVDWIGQIRGS